MKVTERFFIIGRVLHTYADAKNGEEVPGVDLLMEIYRKDLVKGILDKAIAGLSPGYYAKDRICSLCGKSIAENCGHVKDGCHGKQLTFWKPINPVFVECSLVQFPDDPKARVHEVVILKRLMCSNVQLVFITIENISEKQKISHIEWLVEKEVINTTAHQYLKSYFRKHKKDKVKCVMKQFDINNPFPIKGQINAYGRILDARLSINLDR